MGIVKVKAGSIPSALRGSVKAFAPITGKAEVTKADPKAEGRDLMEEARGWDLPLIVNAIKEGSEHLANALSYWRVLAGVVYAIRPSYFLPQDGKAAGLLSWIKSAKLDPSAWDTTAEVLDKLEGVLEASKDVKAAGKMAFSRGIRAMLVLDSKLPSKAELEAERAAKDVDLDSEKLAESMQEMGSVLEPADLRSTIVALARKLDDEDLSLTLADLSGILSDRQDKGTKLEKGRKAS